MCAVLQKEFDSRDYLEAIGTGGGNKDYYYYYY